MCTYLEARKRLFSRDFTGALAIALPFLERRPGDLVAWHLSASALNGLGHREVALKNLRSLADAAAACGHPIFAVVVIKEIAAAGGEYRDLLQSLAALYSRDSSRLKELRAAPPPIRSVDSVSGLSADEDPAVLLARAEQAMAVAWGEALTIDRQTEALPYIPILSALAPDDFALFVEVMTKHEVHAEEVIVAEQAEGDALFIIAEGEVAVTRLSDNGGSDLLAKLGPGAFFGEMAIVSRARRAAEVRAREHTVILKVAKSEIERLCERAPEIGNVLVAFCHARMLENLMRISPVLSPVPAAKRPHLLAAFSTDFRRSGSVIIEEGGEGPGLFLVVSGEVVVSRIEEGEEMVITALRPGDVFGEISLLLRKPSTATVTAGVDSAFLFLSAADFNEVTREFPELLKGAFDIAIKREDQNNSILAARADTTEDLILI